MQMLQFIPQGAISEILSNNFMIYDLLFRIRTLEASTSTNGPDPFVDPTSI